MSQENVERLLEGYEAWNRGEMERIPEFFAPDNTHRSSGAFPGLEPIYRGHAGMARFWETLTEPWDYFRIEPLRTVHDADLVVAEVRFSGRGAGSGVEVTVDFGHVVRFREGLIVETEAYTSWEEALEAAGLEA